MSTPPPNTAVHDVISNITLLYVSDDLVGLKDAGIEIAKKVVGPEGELGVGFDGDKPDIKENYYTAALRLIVRLLVPHALDQVTLIGLTGSKVTLPGITRVPIKSSSDGGGFVAQGGSALIETRNRLIDLEFATAWKTVQKWSMVKGNARLDEAAKTSAWKEFNIKPEYYPAGSKDTRHLNTILLGFMSSGVHLNLAKQLGLQLRSNLERGERLKALFKELTGKDNFNDYSLEIGDGQGDPVFLPLFGLGSYAGARQGVGFKHWMMFDKRYESNFSQGEYPTKMATKMDKKGTYSGNPVTMNEYYAQRIVKILEIWARKRGIEFEIAEAPRSERKPPLFPRDDPLAHFGKLIPLPRYHPYIINAVLPDPYGTKGAKLAEEAFDALRAISYELRSPAEAEESIGTEAFRKNVNGIVNVLVNDVTTTRVKLLKGAKTWLKEGVEKLTKAKGISEDPLEYVEEILTLKRVAKTSDSQDYTYSTDILPNVALLAAKTLFDELNLGQNYDAGNTAEALRTAVNVILERMFQTLDSLPLDALCYVVHTPYSKDGSGGDDIQDGDGIPDDDQETETYFPPPDLLIPPQGIGTSYTRFDGPIYRWLLRARKLQNNKEEVKNFIMETSKVLKDAYGEGGAGTLYGLSGIMRPFIRLVGYLLEEAYGPFSGPKIEWMNL